MASERGSPLRDEDSGSSWSPPSAEDSSGSASGSPPGSKLFIFNLERTVSNADLEPIFAPFAPIYTCVAIGKKGTSRRFGFAKFVDAATAAAAMEALQGQMLHGKALSLKSAVALGEPEYPIGGGDRKFRIAKQLKGSAACTQQDLSPRIAAMRSPSAVPSFTYSRPASAEGTPARLLAHGPSMQHLLVVEHTPGLSHDDILTQCWLFRPLSISTAANGAGPPKTSLLFSTQQQARAAQDALLSCPTAGCTSLVAIPLHGGPSAPAAPAEPPLAHFPPQAVPHPAPAPAQQAAAPQVAGPPGPPLFMWCPPQAAGSRQAPPPAAPAQAQQPAAPAQQQVRADGVGSTMRPLWAAPPQTAPHRPGVPMPPPAVYSWHHPGMQPAMRPPPPRPPARAPPPPGPPPPPFHHLAGANWPGAAPPPQLPPGLAFMEVLPDSLEGGGDGGGAASHRQAPQLNPAAKEFSPTKPPRPAAGSAGGGSSGGGRRSPQVPAPQFGAPFMQPVMRSIISGIEAALSGHSFVPSWDRVLYEPNALQPGQPLVVAEALESDSGTEDEGDTPPDPKDIFAAVAPFNLNTCFVTRALMRRLAPVEVLLKHTAVGDAAAAPSVLAGAVVRVLIDKAYKLRQISGTYIKDSGRLMLVLHDVSSPIPADHISNHNPLLLSSEASAGAAGGAAAGAASVAPVEASQLPASAEEELLELQARLAFHGRRLFRHEVAATAWRLQFAEHWAAESSGCQGDELRLAAAQLRAMLDDADEIRWRRRGVHGLDLAQETALIAQTFRLSWASAANWMAQGSPARARLVEQGCPGGQPRSADRSNLTGDYESRAPLSQHEVLGLQRSERLLPSRAAARSLLRAAADGHGIEHERFMEGVYAGLHPPPRQEQQPAAAIAAARSASAAASAANTSPGSEGAAAAAEEEEGQGLEAEDSEAALLAEAAACLDAAESPTLTQRLARSLKLGGSPSPLHPARGGAENTAPGGAAPSGRQAAASTAKILEAARAAALERAGSGRIAAVHAHRQ